MEDVKVSIIVPVYNAEKYFERCINSLKNQTLREIEIILVDDASPDSCPALCDAAAKGDARIRVIHKENAGAGLARNSGLAIATGKYIGFVDSDDYVSADMFQKLYDTAEKYSSDLVMSGIVFEGGKIFKSEGAREEKTFFEADTHFETEEERRYLRLGIVGALPGEPDDSRYGMSVWKNLFRRDIISENSLSFCSERETMSEDALFMIDYIECIDKATGIRDALYHYCRNADSISKGYSSERLMKSLVFIGETEKRYARDIPEAVYRTYLDRFAASFCRVLASQEIMYSEENGIKYAALRKNLKEICENDVMRKALRRYPIWSLPITQASFAFAMRHRMYFVQKILVNLRNR